MTRNVDNGCFVIARPIPALLFALALVGGAALALLSGCSASCKPMEVNGVNMNCSGGAQGYMWTGSSCIYTHACNCTGPDCQRLYPSQDACENAHLHCTPGQK
jgi:hypothetical protein